MIPLGKPRPKVVSLFPSKEIDIDMISSKSKQKHRVKREKTLQINRYFMCLPRNTYIKKKRGENLFYTSNLKILHSLQVFILGPELGVLYVICVAHSL